MNERLKELKLMALEKFAYNHGLRLTHLGDLDPKSQEEVDSLFSELILLECESKLLRMNGGYGWIASNLKNHFGVDK
jgi:hypothetical protein